MFIGEFCCLFAYLWIRYQQRKKYGNELTEDEKKAQQEGLALKFSPFWFCIPAAFDICSSTLMYMGLTMVNASVMQIINCTMLVWTALFSYIYLKQRYLLVQYVGLITLFCGVILVGVGTIISSEKKTTLTEDSAGKEVLGVILLIVAMIFAGMLMVAEGKLLKMFYAHPLQIVGVEGATGLGAYIVILLVLYVLPGRIEDSPLALKQICSNGLLAFLVVATVSSLGTFNYFGVSLTKYASATHRAAVNAVRPFVVWIVCLIIRWEDFILLELFGYFVAVYGMLLYYKIVPLAFWTIFKKAEPEPAAEPLEGTATS